MSRRSRAVGKVYLVGAGPGDPGLITRKGAALLSKADCVIYDRLVDPMILELTERKFERIYVGKDSDDGGESQPQINRLLVEKARQHRMVVRLKGGDPTVFGRAAEEMEALGRAGIPYEIVPGVSSAWAAAAAAGIPLTDRRLSSSVAVVTGQEALGKEPGVRWEALSRGADTLVILMGWTALPEIVKRLKRAGRSGSTPIALIRWASTPRQELLISSLNEIEKELARRPDFKAPVVIVVGEVVRWAKRFRTKPLKRKRILLTRPAPDNAGLARRLQSLGATCVHLPTIEIRPRKLSRLEEGELLKKLPDYDWVLFTSRHGVETLHRASRHARQSLAKLIRGKVCAIGPRTTQAARAAGLKTDLVPKGFSTAGIRQAFQGISVERKRILIPRSNLGVRDELAQELRRRGAQVDEIVLYETAPLPLSPRRVKQALRGLDAATFTSASTVRGFLQGLRGAGLNGRCALNETAVVAIGPATAEALKEGGIRRPTLPKGSWTIDGLVDAVVETLSAPAGYLRAGVPASASSESMASGWRRAGAQSTPAGRRLRQDAR